MPVKNTTASSCAAWGEWDRTPEKLNVSLTTALISKTNVMQQTLTVANYASAMKTSTVDYGSAKTVYSNNIIINNRETPLQSLPPITNTSYLIQFLKGTT